MTLVRRKPAAARSGVKHSTTALPKNSVISVLTLKINKLGIFCESSVVHHNSLFLLAVNLNKQIKGTWKKELVALLCVLVMMWVSGFFVSSLRMPWLVCNI